MKLTYQDKIKHQELYVGNNKKKDYFEGWYFKHVDNTKKHSISFIVGISKSEDSHSFIQIIDNIKNKSYYVKFALEDFEFSHEPFYIKIKENYFSLERIYVEIEEPVKIIANIAYHNLTEIDSDFYAPNIMGPFAYLPFMECSHAVISMRHHLMGHLEMYGKEYDFDHGVGYIEKDYGTSFPNKYLWLQSNANKKSNFFLAVANIPFLKLNFQGLICILEINKKQYRFATYYLGRAKIKKLEDNKYLITIKQRKKTLEIKLSCKDTIKLISPKNGKMQDVVKESLSSTCNLVLYHKKKKIFEENFTACGSEIFNY